MSAGVACFVIHLQVDGLWEWLKKDVQLQGPFPHTLVAGGLQMESCCVYFLPVCSGDLIISPSADCVPFPPKVACVLY